MPVRSGQEEGWWAGVECRHERRIVPVGDDDESARRTLDNRRQRERGAWDVRRLEGRSLDGDKDLQVDRVIAIGLLDRDAFLLNVRGGMRREVRMHRCRMVIVVIRIDMSVQEGRGQGAALNGKRETECQRAADHGRYCLSESHGGGLKSF